MCGIAGWINFTQNIKDNFDIIEKMSETLVKRGPDSNGYFIEDNIMLAHRRLIVIDPIGGGQPMEKEYYGNKYVICYNGELYNTSELKKILLSKSYTFSSHSDTEVLLTSYIEWGPKCVNYINGIFAFAIWDQNKQNLFLARDHFGVKPLFYTQIGDSFIFGSELKTILAHPYVKPVIGKEGLCELLCLGPSRTPGHGIIKNVNELKPAHYLILTRSHKQISCYWHLEAQPHSESLAKTIDTVQGLVTDAIERQLVSDVKLCTFLSGGIDSSIITAIAANYYKNNLIKTLNT